MRPCGHLSDVVPGVVAEAAQGHLGPDRLLLRRDHRVDPAPLERAVDLAVGVALVGGHRRRRVPGQGGRRVDPLDEVVALVRLARGDLQVQHHAAGVIDGGVLLVAGLEPPVAGVGRHARIGIGQADLLVPA